MRLVLWICSFDMLNVLFGRLIVLLVLMLKLNCVSFWYVLL